MAGTGMKAYNKAQKDKAVVKRAAAAAAAAGKSKKTEVKTTVTVEDKVEHAKVPEAVQENAVSNNIEIGAVADDKVGKVEEHAGLSDCTVTQEDVVSVSTSDAVSTSVAAHDGVPNGPDTSDTTTQELSARTHLAMQNMFTEHDAMVNTLIANLDSPIQFLKRTELHGFEAMNNVLYRAGVDQRETFPGAERAVDDNGFECIGFRVKDTAQGAAAVSDVLSIDQLFAMFNKGVEILAISDLTKVTQPLEIVEKNHLPIAAHPLSTIAEEDSDSMSPRSSSTVEHSQSSQSSVASTVKGTELFSRSATPFSDIAEKQKPVVRLPSGSSSSHASRALECTKAGVALYRKAIKKDSNIPFDPATKIAKITVYHNVGEVPTEEQIKAAFVFTCPDETLETSASVTASPIIDPAIVSFKEKKQDISIATKPPVDVVDPAILSASVKKQETIDTAILNSKVKDLSPTAAVFVPSGVHTPSSPISLKDGSDIIKAALGIATPQDPSSRRTSGSLPTVKDITGPHTPDTPTFQASHKNAVLPEHGEKEFVPAPVKEQQNATLPSPKAMSGAHTPIDAIMPGHREEFVPAKQQDVISRAMNTAGSYGAGYDYRDAAPGQYWPEQVYAQYQQPYMYSGPGGYGYSPYDGVPEYYQMAWDAVQYGMH